MAGASKLFNDDNNDEQSFGSPNDNELEHLLNISKDEEENSTGDDLAEQESNPGGGSSNDSNAASPANLRSKEKGDGDSKADDGPFHKSYADEDNGKNGRLKQLRSKLSGLSKNKLLMGAAFGGGGVAIALLIFLLILASSLKIPDLAQNISTYEFARVTRQYSENAQRVTSEVDGTQTLSDKAYTALRNKYETVDTAHVKASQLFNKINSVRPDVAIQNLHTNNGLTFHYEKGIFGREKLVKVSINGTDYPVVEQGFTKYIPVLGDAVKFKNGVTYARDLEPAITASLAENDTNMVTRSIATKRVFQELGVSLGGLKVAQYTHDDERQARLQEEQDKIKTIQNNTVADNSVTDSTKNAVEETEAAAEEAATNPAELEQIIQTGSTPSIKQAISSSLAKSGFNDVVGAVNPVYAIAQPVCIVYDGSLENSGPTIDNQADEQMRSAGLITSIADEQKNGSTEGQDPTGLAHAVEAANDDVGDVSNSNAIKRETNGSVDTSASISPEASAGGEFTLLNATPGIPSSVADTINSLANKACPTLTNTYVAVGVGLASIVAAVFTGGTDEAAGDTAAASIRQVVKVEANNLAERLVVRGTTFAGKAGDLVFSTAKSAATIAGATVFAKLVVASRAGQINSGFSQSTDLDNQGDSGAGLLGGEISRQTQYGRALTTPEVAQSATADQKFISYENSQQSIFDRYLATSNANSLISHMAIDLNGQVHGSLVSSILRIGAAIFNPMRIVGLFSGHAAAAITPTNTYYGNVQFGWSEDEESLIDSNASYRPLENEDILDSASINGQAANDFISTTYASCFTDSLGTLLSSGEVQRDSDGNVTDQGKCAPQNLGPNNPQYGDLVFRWRLSQSYSTEADQLNDDDTIGSDATTNSAASTSATTASAASLASQILANKNIDISGRDVQQDVQAAAQGQPGTAGAMTSAAILNLIETLGKSHTVTVSAIQSGGTGHCNNTPKSGCPAEPHYNGDAVDFSVLDGLALTGRDANSLTIIQTAEMVLPTGSRFGQSECGATPALPSGFTTFEDTCNHLHVDVPAGTP